MLHQIFLFLLYPQYELVLQETRGVRTAYVLKKDKDYVGCRTETLSKEETCYIMELIKP